MKFKFLKPLMVGSMLLLPTFSSQAEVLDYLKITVKDDVGNTCEYSSVNEEFFKGEHSFGFNSASKTVSFMTYEFNAIELFNDTTSGKRLIKFSYSRLPEGIEGATGIVGGKNISGLWRNFTSPTLQATSVWTPSENILLNCTYKYYITGQSVDNPLVMKEAHWIDVLAAKVKKFTMNSYKSKNVKVLKRKPIKTPIFGVRG